MFANESPSEKTHNPLRPDIILQHLSEVVFISRRTPGFPVGPLLSIYWLWSMQDADIFFYSCMVLYRLLLCMSFSKLESHRTHTFCHSEGGKSAHSYFLLWLWAWLETWECEFKELQKAWLVGWWYLIIMDCLGGERGAGISTEPTQVFFFPLQFWKKTLRNSSSGPKCSSLYLCTN